MKRKNIISFLGLLFVAPFLTAFGDASKDYDVYYSDYKADYVLLDTSDEAMNLYKITYENTGNCYLYDNSFSPQYLHLLSFLFLYVRSSPPMKSVPLNWKIRFDSLLLINTFQ